jgi:hypothetical protein
MMRALRNLILLVVLGSVGVWNAGAQNFNEDLHLEQAQIATTSPNTFDATSLIHRAMQDGDQRSLFAHPALAGLLQDGNLSLVRQDGELNMASILQMGRANLAVIAQDGSRNLTELEQIGERNIFGAWLTGNDNQLLLRQHGNDNVYMLDFVGNDLNHSVDQIGSGIRAIQVGHGSKPFSVEQRGEGMDIRIEHNMH